MADLDASMLVAVTACRPACTAAAVVVPQPLIVSICTGDVQHAGLKLNAVLGPSATDYHSHNH